jgi:pyruvate formate lyase activating enzyme
MPDKPFYDESGGGVTLSGGEPLFQPDFALELLGALHAQGLHTAVETSGFFPSDLIEPLARVCDLFLFDLKHLDPAKHREGAGADNQLILENFHRLLDLVGGKRVIARVPLIPGFNADEESVAAIAEFLKRADYAGPVHLLPFHAWARDKYRRLGREWPYHGVAGVGDDMMIQVLAAIEARGFKHQLYG